LLITEIKSITKQINASIYDITDTITHTWTSQTEDAIGRDIDKAVEMGYDIKEIVGGKASKTKILISESHLVIKTLKIQVI